MSSPSDDESRSNSEPEYSDGENNGSPETLEAPQAMSKEPVKCPVNTSSDKSTSERTQTDKDTNQVDPEKPKIRLCRNNSKIKYQNRRKRQNQYP